MKTGNDAVEAIRNLLVELREEPDTWENPSLDRFLDAMAAWTEDSGRKDSPASWDLIIEMLRAGKLYE